MSGVNQKTVEQYFIDWEAHVFGFGYGTGEEHTLAAVKNFMATVGREDSPVAYDYEKIESVVGKTVTWLLINILCRANIIEYGTSPRYGWLTSQGVSLKDFVANRSAGELAKLCAADDDYMPCSPGSCNCDGPKCANPFWR